MKRHKTLQLCQNAACPNIIKLPKLTKTLNCLGKFRAQWNNRDDLSDGFKAILLRKLELFKVGGEKEQAWGIVSLATNGFCRMGVSWEQICDVFTFDSDGKTEMMDRSIFAESVDLMSTNELANILWSLGMRRTKWTEICGGVPKRGALRR